MQTLKSTADTAPSDQLIGWREWIIFPEFGNVRVKAKTDTGARTSAIDVHNIDITRDKGVDIASFELRLSTTRPQDGQLCRAPVVGRRLIRNSGGDVHDRLIVRTSISLGGQTWPIELSLTERPSMKFHMLLGRTSISGRFLVDTSRSYLASVP